MVKSVKSTSKLDVDRTDALFWRVRRAKCVISATESRSGFSVRLARPRVTLASAKRRKNARRLQSATEKEREHKRSTARVHYSVMAERLVGSSPRTLRSGADSCTRNLHMINNRVRYRLRPLSPSSAYLTAHFDTLRRRQLICRGRKEKDART